MQLCINYINQKHLYHFDSRIVNVCASCAGTLQFKSRAVQFLHSFAQHHRFNIMQGAVLPWCYDAETGAANSLHASMLYGGEYNKR